MFMKISSRFLKAGLLSVSFLLWALALRAQEPAEPAGEKSTLRAIGAPPESASYSVSITQNKSEDLVKVADDIHVAAGEKIEGDVVAVMGNIVIDGIVLGDVTAVMGDIKLGPKAVVEGKLNVLAGQLQRDRGATVLGKITQEDSRSRSAFCVSNFIGAAFCCFAVVRHDHRHPGGATGFAIDDHFRGVVWAGGDSRPGRSSGVA